MLILDLTDKLARFPIAYGPQPVKGWAVKHFDTPTGTSFQRTKQNALGEGPWDACERLYVDAFPIDPADFIFHPGDANDAPDANFPSDSSHPWTAYISAKCRAGISEDQTDKLFGIYRTLRTGNYNGAGQQLNSIGSIVSPSDPRTEFFYKNNPANVAVDQILRWGLRISDIINWPAWVNWRDYNDELIPIDDSTYTPRSLSLTPTSGGTLSPGTYYVRVSTMKGGDESSASLKTLETKTNKITLIGGQTAFQVNWLIKGDEEIPPANPSGITGYRVYIGTVDGVWLGYFTVSNPVSRTFLITTTSGTTAGNPLELATSGLLTNVKRFECGLFFIPPYDLGQALDQICQISCADWQWSGLGTNTYRNDKIRFMSPADRAPVFTLNLAETGMGSLKTYPVDRRNRPNQVVVNFRDQDDEFLGPAQPVILDREQLQTDDGFTKTHTIEGGTMRRNQAQRVASFYARVLCDMDQMATLIASPKTYSLLPGDVINVTNPMPDWIDQKFIVRKKNEKVETVLGDDILSQVYTNGLYSDTQYQPLPLPLPTPRLDPFAIPPEIVTVFLVSEVTKDMAGIPLVSIIGLVQFAVFMAPQIGRVWVAKPIDKDTPSTVYEQTEVIVVPDPSNLQGVFKLSGVTEGPYRIKVVTESSLGGSLGEALADVYEIDVEAPVQATPTSLISNFDSIEGSALFEWSGEEFPSDPSKERYEFEIRNSSDTGTLRNVIVCPFQVREQSEPIIWKVVPGSTSFHVTLLDSGGMSIAPLGSSESPVTINSITKASIVDGLLIEFEIPANGKIPPLYFMAYPEDELATFGNDYTMTWRRTYYLADNKYFMTPDGLDTSSPVRFPIISGDRFSILIRPDGIAEYHINRLGSSSNPVYVSAKKTKPTVLYKVQVEEQTLPNPNPAGIEIANSRWIRRGPEWRYFPGAQRLDFGLTFPNLPGTIRARVRQFSPYYSNIFSDWLDGVFIR
jgi:hypothetical protein